jgi:hypothetical protein
MLIRALNLKADAKNYDRKNDDDRSFCRAVRIQPE